MVNGNSKLCDLVGLLVENSDPKYCVWCLVSSSLLFIGLYLFILSSNE